MVLSLTIKCGLLSEALDFAYSALDNQQRGFLLCFQYLTCTFPIIQLSHNVILSYIQSLGVNQRFLFGLKVVLIPVAAALPASWLRKMPNLTYCLNKDNTQKQDL